MGLGYIGLPTAALIASKGMMVNGVDVNKSVVDTINKGKIHIVEPDLEGLVHYGVQRGHPVASTQVKPADVFLVAVPTPFKGNHQPDLSFVEKATRMVLLQFINHTSRQNTLRTICNPNLIFQFRAFFENYFRHLLCCSNRTG